MRRVPVADRGVVADALAEVLPALHRPAPSDAPVNPWRGVPLQARDPLTRRHAQQARAHLGDRMVGSLLDLVNQACSASAWPEPPVWCHGDLHDANLVLDTAADPAGVGVLDFGDLTGGDPAIDLRVLWTTFGVTHRDRAVRRLEASRAYDDAVWVRARGWAAAFVLGLAADEDGRAVFAAAAEHARAQLGCP